MSHRIYISGCDKGRACELKNKLEAAGHRVVSTWHDGECKRTKDREADEMVGASEDAITEISEDVSVLVADCPGDRLTPGGLYVDIGAALASGVGVVALGAERADGTRVNNRMYHPLVSLSTDDSVVQAVEEFEEDDDDLDDFDDDDFETDDFDDDEEDDFGDEDDEDSE